MMLGEVLVRFGAETTSLREGIAQSTNGLLGLLNPINLIKGAFAQIASGTGNLAFGFRNLGTAGTIGMDAIKLGQADVLSGILKLGVAAAALAAIFVAIAGVIGIAIGVIAVKAAADFQQGLSRLRTGAGDVTDNMAKMGQAILQVSTATGVMTGPLLQAMYQIISAGQRGAQAEDTLAVSAKGAVAEQAKIVDVAKAISTAMTDYGTAQYNATQFMNGYTRATQLGKITLEQLSTSMSPILPIAKNMGVSFADVAGAMATMTNAGVPAERSATSLRFVMQSLENPTKKARDEMAAMGLNSVAVGNEMKVSLPGALEMVYNAAKRAGPEGSVPFNRAVSDMIGGQRSLQAFMALTGGHFKTFVTDTQQVANAMNASKTAVLGWDTAQKNLNVQWDRAKAAVNALFITIGTALLPVLTQLVSTIVPIIARFTDWVIRSNAVENALKAIAPIAQAIGAGFMLVLPMIIQLWTAFVDVVQRTSAWLQQNRGFMEALKYTVIALGVAIGVILLAALVVVVAAFAVVVIAIVVVVAIVQAGIQAVRAFGDVWNRTGAAIGVAIAWIVTAFHTLITAAVTVFNAVRQAIVTAFQATITWIVGAWNAAIAFIVSVWNTLRGAAVTAWNSITTAIQTAVNSVINWLKSVWQNVVTAIVGFFQWLYNHNYLWQGMCDTIRNVVQAVVSWLQSAWSAVVQFIVNLWDTLSSTASSVWSSITSAIQSANTAIASFVRSIWGAVVSFLTGLWNALRGTAASVWNAISSAIQSANTAIASFVRGIWSGIVSFLAGVWATIVGAVQSAWAAITGAISGGVSNAKAPITGFGSWLGGFFSGLAQAAVAWGGNIVRSLASGIAGAIGAVISAAKNVAATIASFLGFHSPAEQGPGRDLDIWGPALARGFAQGITKGIPDVQAAVTLMMRPLESTMKTDVGTVTSGMTTGGPSGSSEIITLLRSIDQKLDSGRPYSRYELTQALGLLLADGVRR